MVDVFVKSLIHNNLEAVLEDLLIEIKLEDKLRNNSAIFIKPNFTYPFHKPGVTTSPLFLDGLLAVLSHRKAHVIVGESDGGYQGWPADLAFKGHGMYEICKKYKNVELLNLSRLRKEVVEFKVNGKGIYIELPCLLLHDIDISITVPVPKVHVMTTFSCALKNQWGCIPDGMRIRYHPVFDKIIFELNKVLHFQYAIADATYMLNRTGPMFGDPISTDLILASSDCGALDVFCCRLMNLDVQKIGYLRELRDNGMIPSFREIRIQGDLSNVEIPSFHVHRSIRHRITLYGFKHFWVNRLFWDSMVARILHKILYFFVGNPVAQDVKKTKEDYNI